MQLPNTEKKDENALYRRFAANILTYLSQQVVNRQDAEDLLLEVFLSAFKTPELQDLPEARQLAWLRKVARNKVIDHYRHHGLVSWLPLMQIHHLEDERLTPEGWVEQQENYTRLYQAIQQLSPTQQELIHLRYGHELHFPEIAEMLKKSEGTVRKMLSRTIRQLHTYYEQQERSKK